MAELRLTGPTEDGDALSLAAPDGTEHTLPFSVFLRRLVLEHTEQPDASSTADGDEEAADASAQGGTPSADSEEAPAPQEEAPRPGPEAPRPQAEDGPSPLAPRIHPPLLPESTAPAPAPRDGTVPAAPSPAPTPARPADAMRRPSPTTPVAEQEDVRAAAAQEAPPLSPREIQQRIRAGASVEQVARESGNSFARIRGYGFPVLAERSYVAQQARAAEIWVGGPDLYAGTVEDGGPSSLGELVEHRLNELGVDASTLEWDAWREPSGTWTVTASFQVAEGAVLPASEEPPARWTYRPAGHHIDPVNRWARLLSEAEAWDVFTPGRATAAPAAPQAPAEEPRRADPEPSVTPMGTRRAPGTDPDADLLEILRARRGQRVGADTDSDDALAHLLAREAATREAARQAAEEAAAEADSRLDAVEDEAHRQDAPPQDEAAAPAATPAAEDAGPRPARTLHALPTPPETVTDPAAPAPQKRHDAPRPEQGGAPEEPGAPAEAEPAPEKGRMPVPRPRARTTGRRASVPSWDEIVFGRKGD